MNFGEPLQVFIPLCITERFVGNTGLGLALYLAKLRRKIYYYIVVLVTLFIIFFLLCVPVLDQQMNVLTFFRMICYYFCLYKLFCSCEFSFFKKVLLSWMIE